MRTVLAVIGMVVLCAQAFADSLDLSFNSDAVRLIYNHEFRANNLNLDGGLLYNKDKGSVLHVGLNLSGLASSGTNPVTAGLGARFVYADGDLPNQKGAAFPVGGYVRFSPPRFNRFSIAGDVYFAPDILSVGDTEKYEEYAIRVGYNVTREADIYLGARYINAKYKYAPDAMYDNGMHIGLALRF